MYNQAIPAISQYANANYTKYRKEKPIGVQFEDTVWMMFYNMGFDAMNSDNQFRIVNDPKNPALTKQIDVFAVEDEIVFGIECKTSETPEEPRQANFKTDIEALRGNKENLRKEIMNKYPDRKVVFVWASRGLILGAKDKERLKEWDIVHFDDSAIQYYHELTTHLGRAARYQLLGNILKGRTIKNLDTDVVAVEAIRRMSPANKYRMTEEKLIRKANMHWITDTIISNTKARPFPKILSRRIDDLLSHIDSIMSLIVFPAILAVMLTAGLQFRGSFRIRLCLFD